MAGVTTTVFQEDEFTRQWQMTLSPGLSSGLHTHTLRWFFIITAPAKLKLIDEKGNILALLRP